MFNIKWALLLLLLQSFTTPEESQAIVRSINGNTNPEELGDVKWERNLDETLQSTATDTKPIFLLFQEVPGCATCRNYGHEVLSHPLIVEAIETLFQPVAIYNNKKGEDAKTLAYFGEPAWNNPVVRIIDRNKKDIVERISGNYSKLGVVQSMILALKRQGQAVPLYLELLEQELYSQAQGLETATLGMFCFWTGEKKLGALEGVIETQPGFMSGREVVQVQYDPSVISYTEVVKEAQAAQCASQVYVGSADQQARAEKLVGKSKIAPLSRFRLDHEPKYYLSKTLYKYLPMTAIQATKANSLIGQGASPDEVFSARQIALLTHIQAHLSKGWKDAIGVDLMTAWKAVDKIKGAAPARR